MSFIVVLASGVATDYALGCRATTQRSGVLDGMF